MSPWTGRRRGRPKPRVRPARLSGAAECQKENDRVDHQREKRGNEKGGDYPVRSVKPDRRKDREQADDGKPRCRTPSPLRRSVALEDGSRSHDADSRAITYRRQSDNRRHGRSSKSRRQCESVAPRRTGTSRRTAALRVDAPESLAVCLRMSLPQDAADGPFGNLPSALATCHATALRTIGFRDLSRFAVDDDVLHLRLAVADVASSRRLVECWPRRRPSVTRRRGSAALKRA